MAELRTDPSAQAGEALTIPLRRELPTGTVTFVFTDIEGSTKLARELGTERWGEVLVQHASIVRTTSRAHEGVEVRTEGDSFFLAFRSAAQAVAAAADAQRAFAAQQWAHGVAIRVRIGMHTGEGARPGTPEDAADYVGYDVHRAARVAAAAHGGQVLISSATRMLLGERLPAAVTLKSLGEHRLKDLSQPDELFQLVIDSLPSEFPVLRTLSTVPNNLPVQLTSFIGRRRALAEARALLDGTRLLTLVGPGGTGKSRLSLELAANVMSSFEDGVWFVRLAAVTDPGLVASQIAHTLGLVVPPKVTPLQHVVSHLRDKRALLVLDNFEQVVSAAGDLGEILRECPGVKAIVTTRIVLHVAGEQEYPVPPLTLPDPDAAPDVAALSSAEAIQLFLERARAAQPDFMLTAENARAVVGIVAQLDGLPLAIELAAARVKILPPQAILDRLASGLGILQSSARDVPARQQTLRGAVAWSYDLLDPGLRRLFQRLAVFRGGGALEEIEQVCGPADEVGREVLEGVSELVDQSLLRRAPGGEPRFVMLETIREFAREQLEAAGEAPAIDGRHIEAYLDLAERAGSQLRSVRQKEWLDRLDLEHGNLRAAMDRAVVMGRIEELLRMTFALWRFWQMRGHLEEGRRRVEQVLALPGARDHGVAYARAVEAAGGVAYWQGDEGAVARWYGEALDLARAIGDRPLLASAIFNHSFTYWLQIADRTPDFDAGIAAAEEALAIYRELGDKAGIASVQWGIAGTMNVKGDLEGAAPRYDEALALAREVGDRFGVIWTLRSSGTSLVKQSRVPEGRERLEEALRLLVEGGDRSGIAILMSDMAEVARAESDPLRAQRLRGASEMMVAQSGSALVRLADRIDQRVSEMASDEERAAFREGAEMTAGEAVSYALRQHGRSGNFT